METKKKKEDKLSNLPVEMINVICTFFYSPLDISSLLLTKKGFYNIIKSNEFWGSENIWFPIGLRHYPMSMEQFQDSNEDKIRKTPWLRDHLGITLPSLKNKEENSKKSAKKRIGLTKDEISKTEPRVNNYVQNLVVIEEGKLWDNVSLLKFLNCFPRLKRLKVDGVGDLKDDFFKELDLVSLDITGCKDLTKRLFGKEFKLCDSLVELTIGTVIKKIDEPVEFAKLEKLVIEAPREGCIHFSYPVVEVMKFPENIKAPRLKCVEFYSCKFQEDLMNGKFEEKRKKNEFFLEGYVKLKCLVLYGNLGTKDHHFDHLFQLEELTVKVTHDKKNQVQILTDNGFRFLTKLKKLALIGGDKFTRAIFENLNKLEYLDISKCLSFYMYSFDLDKNRFSEIDMQNFKKLKVLKFCCKYPISFEEISKGKVFGCGCADYIIKKNLQNYQEEKDTKKIFHPGCSKCLNCEICQEKKDCVKLQNQICDVCDIQMCDNCSSRCERCNRQFCPCTRVKYTMSYCPCEYEVLCQQCLNEFGDCEGCDVLVCINCSSRCRECLERKCDDCIKSWRSDEDENEEDIPKEERICESCKEKVN